MITFLNKSNDFILDLFIRVKTIQKKHDRNYIVIVTVYFS